jgi:hypothetical protein
LDFVFGFGFGVGTKCGGIGGSGGGSKPYNIVSLTLIRAFPSSFLPVPSPIPQKGSNVAFYEKLFSIWSNGRKSEKDLYNLGTSGISEFFPHMLFPICKLQVNNICHLVAC